MPGTQAELQATYEQAVNRAILDKRRHQYLQEYPGGPIDRYAFAGKGGAPPGQISFYSLFGVLESVLGKMCGSS